MHRRFAWVDQAPARLRYGELSSTPASLKWENTLDTAELAFLRSHRVGLVSLLPGTCYIEFARNVAVASNGLVPYSLGAINFEVLLCPASTLTGSASLNAGSTVRAHTLLCVCCSRSVCCLCHCR